jgi:hypothetical protein
MNRAIDGAGTVLISVLLLAGSGVAWMGSRHVMGMRRLLAEAGGNELPGVFKFLAKVQSFHGVDLLILTFFLMGLLALVLIRDRLRANFYGGLFAVLLTATGGVFFFMGMSTFVSVFEVMLSDG